MYNRENTVDAGNIFKDLKHGSLTTILWPNDSPMISLHHAPKALLISLCHEPMASLISLHHGPNSNSKFKFKMFIYPRPLYEHSCLPDITTRWAKGHLQNLQPWLSWVLHCLQHFVYQIPTNGQNLNLMKFEYGFICGTCLVLTPG